MIKKTKRRIGITKIRRIAIKRRKMIKTGIRNNKEKKMTKRMLSKRVKKTYTISLSIAEIKTEKQKNNNTNGKSSTTHLKAAIQRFNKLSKKSQRDLK